jgi:peptidyl-prolyl cis-trans isomerase SurA
MKRILVPAVAAALLLAACTKKPPAGVAAEVNGTPITYAELDKTYNSQYPQQPEGVTEDQIQAQKIDVLSNLVINQIMLQRAEKMGLLAVDSDVEAEVSKMRAP